MAKMAKGWEGPALPTTYTLFMITATSAASETRYPTLLYESNDRDGEAGDLF